MGDGLELSRFYGTDYGLYLGCRETVIKFGVLNMTPASDSGGKIFIQTPQTASQFGGDNAKIEV